MKSRNNNKEKSQVLFSFNDRDISYGVFLDVLMDIGVEKGDVLFMHSDISVFGKLCLFDREALLNSLVNVLKESVGDEGTIIMPAFTYSFTRDEVFDLENTKSEAGTLTEFFRQMPDVVRTEHPIFSSAIWGKRKEEFVNTGKDSFDENSIFGKLHKQKGKLLIFGSPFDTSCTYLHYVEQMYCVPYRYSKTFKGKVRKDGHDYEDECSFFVRYPGGDVIFDKHKTERLLLDSGIFKVRPLGGARIMMADAEALYNEGFRLLDEDIYCFLENRPDETFGDFNFERYGVEIYELIKRLYPIYRSITGDGVRETLRVIGEHIPLEVHEIKSGTMVFDWVVPKEWNIKDAYIADSKGNRIVDFKKNNLYVLNYSTPVCKKVTSRELKKHLYTLPDYPDWIRYVTSYYKEEWGFSMPHRVFESLDDRDEYEVFIDSEIKDGFLTYGELLLKGETEEEVLFSSYTCHPSLCNDNLSGISLMTFLIKYLMDKKLKYSYRFLFSPETIGAITWLCLNEGRVSAIKHGLVITCVGDSGKSVYKRSRRGDAEIDRVVEKVLADSGEPFEIIDFFPMGGDERQFCSPGFNLPVGSLMRTPYGRYPEYHTSADNLDFVGSEYLADSFGKYVKVIYILENNVSYINLNPKCEPQLGRRGLYPTIGSKKGYNQVETAYRWVLSMSDGGNSILDIAIKSGLKFSSVKQACDNLKEQGLLKEVVSKD